MWTAPGRSSRAAAGTAPSPDHDDDYEEEDDDDDEDEGHLSEVDEAGGAGRGGVGLEEAGVQALPRVVALVEREANREQIQTLPIQIN